MRNNISANKAFTKRAQGYRNIEKDPTLEEVMKIVHASGMSFAEIERKSGVSTSTLYNWDYGKTKRGFHLTYRYVLKACGYRFSIEALQ